MLNSTMKKSKQKAGNSKSNVKSTSSLTRSNESDEDFRSTVSDETTIPIDKKKAITKSNKPKVDDDDGHQDQDEDFRCKDTTPPKLLFHEEPSMTNENRNVKVLAEIPVPNSIGVASDIEDFPCENPSPPPETYYDDDSQTIKANDKKTEEKNKKKLPKKKDSKLLEKQAKEMLEDISSSEDEDSSSFIQFHDQKNTKTVVNAELLEAQAKEMIEGSSNSSCIDDEDFRCENSTPMEKQRANMEEKSRKEERVDSNSNSDDEKVDSSSSSEDEFLSQSSGSDSHESDVEQQQKDALVAKEENEKKEDTASEETELETSPFKNIGNLDQLLHALPDSMLAKFSTLFPASANTNKEMEGSTSVSVVQNDLTTLGHSLTEQSANKPVTESTSALNIDEEPAFLNIKSSDFQDVRNLQQLLVALPPSVLAKIGPSLPADTPSISSAVAAKDPIRRYSPAKLKQVRATRTADEWKSYVWANHGTDWKVEIEPFEMDDDLRCSYWQKQRIERQRDDEKRRWHALGKQQQAKSSPPPPVIAVSCFGFVGGQPIKQRQQQKYQNANKRGDGSTNWNRPQNYAKSPAYPSNANQQPLGPCKYGQNSWIPPYSKFGPKIPLANPQGKMKKGENLPVKEKSQKKKNGKERKEKMGGGDKKEQAEAMDWTDSECDEEQEEWVSANGDSDGAEKIKGNQKPTGKGKKQETANTKKAALMSKWTKNFLDNMTSSEYEEEAEHKEMAKNANKQKQQPIQKGGFPLTAPPNMQADWVLSQPIFQHYMAGVNKLIQELNQLYGAT